MTIVGKDTARPFTYDDLWDMPDDGYRREIIGGSLILNPSPNFGHQYVIGNLFTILHAAALADTVVVLGPYDWKLADGGTLVPDLVVIRRQDADRHGPLPASAVPLLAVEVLSPSNRAYDRSYKRSVYESSGVPAYWIIDPDGPSLLALRLVGGVYEVEADLSSGQFVTDRPFPVNCDVSALDE